MIYSYKNEPLKIFGIVDFEKNKELRRLPDDILEKIQTLSFLGKRCPGARLCFRTDAASFTVKIYFQTLSVDIGMSIYAGQSAHVFIGDRKTSTFAGIVHPSSYDDKIFEATFQKSNKMEDITVFLPRNEIIDNIEIIVDENAHVEPPTPYIYSKPIVYYGSSITEGGCCCNPSNAYNAVISRRLDVDYYNLGFSGNARGEIEMADFISGIDMSIFVLDYDHNAPDVEHLEKTHEPFFLRIRKNHPNLPVIMMTRPHPRYNDEEKQRRQIVKGTYERAVASGDKNVYFLDGETFFGKEDAELCLIDGTHPNDLGFYRMARVVEPVIEKLLKKS